jgi:hypothetical protein
MDKEEASRILKVELDIFRQKAFSDLLPLVSEPLHYSKQASSGLTYQIEIQGLWDDSQHKTLRIMASIDDGGLRALHPLSNDFLITSDGKLSS